VCRFEQTLSEFADETNAANQLGKFLHRFVFFGRGNGTCALKPVEIRATRRRLFDFLIPVLVTGIQQRRVCGAEEPLQPKDLVWLDSCDKHRNEGRG